MKDIEFAKLLGGLDEELAASAAPASRKKTAELRPEGFRPAIGFLRRAAAAAAAVICVLFLSAATARAAGVSIISPFVSWTGNALRLDYSAGLDRHEDAPEVTAEPSTAKPTEYVEDERIVFTSEEEFKARFGSLIRMPGEDIGLEFVSADVSASQNIISVITKYFLDGKNIIIESTYHSVAFNNQHSTKALVINGVSSYKEMQIHGKQCTAAYGVPWNYIYFVTDNDSYLVYGETDMTGLITIIESMIPYED